MLRKLKLRQKNVFLIKKREFGSAGCGLTCQGMAKFVQNHKTTP